MRTARPTRPRYSWRTPRPLAAPPPQPSSSPTIVDELIVDESERGLHIGFYSNHLCERGSEVALFDYADYSERLCGARSFILYDAKSSKNVDIVVTKFKARFGDRLIPLEAVDPDLGHAVLRHQLSHCYVIKFGHCEEPALRCFGAAASACRILVHAVFDASEPHGHAYARISPCVPCRPSRRAARVPVVPHIVRPAALHGSDLRAELGIPTSATVFGRSGGLDTFDIPEARAAVLSVALQRSDVWFVLLNTSRHGWSEAWRLVEKAGGGGGGGGGGSGRGRARALPPNIIHLDATVDEARKQAFVRTCDAMLHARRTGETFGLSVAEFSACNKPVLTSSRHHECGAANFHLTTLGGKGLYYHSMRSCEQLLLGFDRTAARRRDWNAFRAFEPAKVMRTFWEVFIRSAPARSCEALSPSSSSDDDDAVDARSVRRPTGAGPAAGSGGASLNPFMLAAGIT